jgi:selenocysteine-specific elongation factor
MKSIVIGTAGHVDHGKSTLVKALTGTDPDRLKEEKERGITIDIGFASLQLGPNVQVGFIDVPGHERFIKNMLAGIGGIDAVLLVVAADESIMPQTREHLDICKLLKIPTGIVAITKSDLVDPDLLELVRCDLQEYLRNSFLEKSPMIAVSSESGSGLEDLRTALQGVAELVPDKDSQTVFRLPIDRCFTLHGFGTVVTGTVISGTIRKDEEVEIYPTGQRVRVRNLQVYGRVVGEASAGQRAALNLLNVEVNQIERGMQLSVPDRFIPCVNFDASVHLLQHSPVALKRQAQVRLHLGSAEVMGFITPLGSREIIPGQTCFARIALERPVLTIPGDPFILRRTSPMATIGGGQVLNSLAKRASRKDSTQIVEHLRALHSGSLKERILGLARQNPFSGIDESEILSQTLNEKAAVKVTLTELAKTGELKILSENPYQAMDISSFAQLAEKGLRAVREFHAKEPLSAGIPKGQLYSGTFKTVSPTAVRTVLEHLVRQGLTVTDQDRVRIAGHQLVLNERESLAKNQIEHAFLDAGWRVPPLDEVLATVPVPADQARQLVTMLTKEKKLIKISESLFFHASSIAQLIDLLAQYRKQNEQIDVGAFKNLTTISRKYAIPLLEYLDRERITRRVGDYRVILVK